MKREYTYDDYLEETFGNGELNKHKASDRIKWILTLIAFVLVTITLLGIILGWFNKVEVEEESALIEVGDIIEELYLNPNKTDEQYIAMIKSLDTSKQQNWAGGTFLYIPLIDFTDGYVVWAEKFSSNGTLGYRFYLDDSPGYDSCGIDFDEVADWSGPRTVAYVYQQELWQDFLSKKPFEKASA